MPDTRLVQPLVPRPLHWWAVLTVAATVALLALGAVVTTFRVGMADPIWPTYPWHLMLVSWEEPRPGFYIEHTHRLAGYVVGCCVIVLAVWLALASRRRYLVVLGWTALAAVIVQGLLGGFRVRLNVLFGADLAAVHGVFAQVVFSLFVGIAVLTSRAARKASPLSESESRSLRCLSLMLAGLTLLQLVWGSLVRHTYQPLAQRLHVLTAFAVVAALACFLKAVWDIPAARRRFRTPALLLVVLFGVQLALGLEAWLARFASGELPELQHVTVSHAVVRTLHVLVGSWLLATAVSCVLLSGSPTPAPAAAEEDDATTSEPLDHPEGVTAAPPAHGVRQLERSA